jgi:hypothetical protein
MTGSCCPCWTAIKDVAAYVNSWFHDLMNGTHFSDQDGSPPTTPSDVALFIGLWFQAVSGGGGC